MDSPHSLKSVSIGQCDGRDKRENLAKAVETFHKADVRVHLFGMTTPKLIRHVKAATRAGSDILALSF